MLRDVKSPYVTALDVACSHEVALESSYFRETATVLPLQSLVDALPLSGSIGTSLTEFAINGDQPTLEHSLRVSMLAMMGATELGYDEKQKQLVGVSGLVHDLGKLEPQIAALVHNGRALTIKERRVVNLHARFSFERFYDSAAHNAAPVRDRLGNFMAHVALDALFSHANAHTPAQRGVDDQYIADLVGNGVITERDAEQHHNLPSAQLLAVADVTDALLSNGRERAYRLARFSNEGKKLEIIPQLVPGLVAETIDTPCIDVPVVVKRAVQQYPAVALVAKRIAAQMVQTTLSHPNY